MKNVTDDYEYDLEEIEKIIQNYGSDGTELITGERKHYGQPTEEPMAINLKGEDNNG